MGHLVLSPEASGCLSPHVYARAMPPSSGGCTPLPSLPGSPGPGSLMGGFFNMSQFGPNSHAVRMGHSAASSQAAAASIAQAVTAMQSASQACSRSTSTGALLHVPASMGMPSAGHGSLHALLTGTHQSQGPNLPSTNSSPAFNSSAVATAKYNRSAAVSAGRMSESQSGSESGIGFQGSLSPPGVISPAASAAAAGIGSEGGGLDTLIAMRPPAPFEGALTAMMAHQPSSPGARSDGQQGAFGRLTSAFAAATFAAPASLQPYQQAQQQSLLTARLSGAYAGMPLVSSSTAAHMLAGPWGTNPAMTSHPLTAISAATSRAGSISAGSLCASAPGMSGSGSMAGSLSGSIAGSVGGARMSSHQLYNIMGGPQGLSPMPVLGFHAPGSAGGYGSIAGSAVGSMSPHGSGGLAAAAGSPMQGPGSRSYLAAADGSTSMQHGVAAGRSGSWGASPAAACTANNAGMYGSPISSTEVSTGASRGQGESANSLLQNGSSSSSAPAAAAAAVVGRMAAAGGLSQHATAQHSTQLHALVPIPEHADIHEADVLFSGMVYSESECMLSKLCLVQSGQSLVVTSQTWRSLSCRWQLTGR